jgi:hypothetical protein
LTHADPASSWPFVIKSKENAMNITATSTNLSQGLVPPGAALPGTPPRETASLNSWPQQVAKIEEALSQARETRRAARGQLLQPALPSSTRASNEALYFNACDTVAFWEHKLDDALNAIY